MRRFGHTQELAPAATGSGGTVLIQVKGYYRNGRYVKPSQRRVKAGSAAAKRAAKAGQVITPKKAGSASAKATGGAPAAPAPDPRVVNYLRGLDKFLQSRGVSGDDLVNVNGAIGGKTTKAHDALLAHFRQGGAKPSINPDGSGTVNAGGKIVKITKPTNPDPNVIYDAKGIKGDRRIQQLKNGRFVPKPKRKGSPSIATVIKRRLGQAVDAVDRVVN